MESIISGLPNAWFSRQEKQQTRKGRKSGFEKGNSIRTKGKTRMLIRELFQARKVEIVHPLSTE